MPKVRRSRVATRVGVVVAVAVAAAAAVVGTVLAQRHSHTAAQPVHAPETTTLPYNPRPGPNGVQVLRETVDPLTLAVPAGWVAPAADQLTLPAQLTALAAQAPALATALQALALQAGKGGIRLFAYQPAAPHAYVAVTSFASPDATPLTPASAAAVVAASGSNHARVVTARQLPIGEVLAVDTTSARDQQHALVEDVLLVTPTRTVGVEMASEVAAGDIPPFFGEIAASLRAR